MNRKFYLLQEHLIAGTRLSVKAGIGSQGTECVE